MFCCGPRYDDKISKFLVSSSGQLRCDSTIIEPIQDEYASVQVKYTSFSISDATESSISETKYGLFFSGIVKKLGNTKNCNITVGDEVFGFVDKTTDPCPIRHTIILPIKQLHKISSFDLEVACIVPIVAHIFKTMFEGFPSSITKYHISGNNIIGALAKKFAKTYSLINATDRDYTDNTVYVFCGNKVDAIALKFTASSIYTYLASTEKNAKQIAESFQFDDFESICNYIDNKPTAFKVTSSAYSKYIIKNLKGFENALKSLKDNSDGPYIIDVSKFLDSLPLASPEKPSTTELEAKQSQKYSKKQNENEIDIYV